MAAILAGNLLAAVRMAKMATKRRNTIPVLGNVLIGIGADCATVVGTDLEASVTAMSVAMGDLAPVTVPADRLAALLARLQPETELTLEHDGKLGRLTVAGGGLKASLVTMPAEDFPKVVRKPDTLRFSIAAPALRRLLDTVEHAISHEETRYYLNGIYLHVVDIAGVKVLRAVATDGHRMMGADMPAPAGAEGLAGVIVPHDTIRILRMLLPGRTDGAVEVIQRQDTSLVFKAGPWVAHTRIIDGTFPEYARVVPALDAKAARIEVKAPKALLQSAEMAAAISTERSRPLKLSNGSGLGLRLEATSPDTGTTEVQVPLDVAAWNEGPRHPEVGVQARYLRDACRAMPKGFAMEVVDGSAPIRLDCGGDAFGVLMPMRV
jgi:DNA polymerase-3 subunit beta